RNDARSLHDALPISARIEEMVEKAKKEVESTIREEGEAATLEVGVHGIHPELVRLLGRMRFRSSYGQNALKHSIEVAQLSGVPRSEEHTSELQSRFD